MIEEAQFAGRWVELESRAVFRITGPDRVRFLNGQVSNDVSGDLALKTKPSCLCSLKGKVEALVWVGADGDSLLVDGEITQREQLFDRLDRYLIADDCEISDETGSLRLIHHFLEGSEDPVSRRMRYPGHDSWIEGELPERFGESSRISVEEFQMAQLISLVPRAGCEITGSEFPAELGLDAWAVDFHKGCYLGQEIVSRIESVGKAKKNLRLIKSDQPAEIMAEITNELGEKGKITGPFLKFEEKKWLSMGLFRTSASGGQSLEYQGLTFS